MEPCVGYAESHDQALVGDKTIAFWLMDKVGERAGVTRRMEDKGGRGRRGFVKQACQVG